MALVAAEVRAAGEQLPPAESEDVGRVSGPVASTCWLLCWRAAVAWGAVPRQAAGELAARTATDPIDPI
jgi:hypothetical protein